MCHAQEPTTGVVIHHTMSSNCADAVFPKKATGLYVTAVGMLEPNHPMQASAASSIQGDKVRAVLLCPQPGQDNMSRLPASCIPIHQL